MDIATAGFLSTCVLTAGGVALKWVAAKPKLEGAKCPLHDGIAKHLDDSDKCMEELQEDSKTTRRLVIAIAAELKIPIGNLKEELQEFYRG